MTRFVRKKEFEAFWMWLQKHEQELYGLSSEEAALQIFKQLSSRWEFNVEVYNGSPEGKKKLIFLPVSQEAASIIRPFSSAAPQLQWFAVSVQRMTRQYSVQLQPDDLEVEVTFMEETGLADLLIYLPDPEEEQEEEDFIQQLFGLLEELLGEHVVATRIGEVTVDHIKNATHSIPLMDLPEWLHDKTKNRL